MSFSVFFILDLFREWGVLKLPVCLRSVAGFTYSQPPPSPSPHKQNRGERFFSVEGVGGGGGGRGCTQASFYYDYFENTVYLFE